MKSSMKEAPRSSESLKAECVMQAGVEYSVGDTVMCKLAPRDLKKHETVPYTPSAQQNVPSELQRLTDIRAELSSMISLGSSLGTPSRFFSPFSK